ncbi:MAG: hypothetical protein HON90_08355 [Halobacteriovoraceae bacterium]|jgi:hypothetical protein|nr:hypothetical protein [Halobacteriovoraceae bacterium]
MKVLKILSFLILANCFGAFASSFDCNSIDLSGKLKVQFFSDSVEKIRLALDIDDEDLVSFIKADFLTSQTKFIQTLPTPKGLKVASTKPDTTYYISVGDNIRTSPTTNSTFCSLEIQTETSINGKISIENEFLLVLGTTNERDTFWVGGLSFYGEEDFNIDMSMESVFILEKI